MEWSIKDRREGSAVRLANWISDSIVDGPGLRLTVFTQGCPHRCPGCHNPDTWDPAGGREVALEELEALLDQNPLLQGLTLSAGDSLTRGQAAVIGQGQKIIAQIAVEGHDLVGAELSVAFRGVTVQISLEKRQLRIKKIHFSAHPLFPTKKRM